jgi:hemolysin III
LDLESKTSLDNGNSSVIGKLLKQIVIKVLASRNPFSFVVQSIGIILSIMGCINLVYIAVTKGTTLHIFSFSLYGASLVALYVASSFYHSINISMHMTALLRRVDQSMIFVLILGSYVPMCLHILPLKEGLITIAMNVMMAALGLSVLMSKKQLTRLRRYLCYGLYLSMGWIIFWTWDLVIVNFHPAGAHLIVLEGILYTFGFLILNLKFIKIIPGIVGSHEIWHLFVMAGSYCHYLAISKYIL